MRRPAFYLACAVSAGAIACTGGQERAHSQSPTGQSGGDPVLAASRASDTEHVRGEGVPTPPDDTLGTRYGKHEGPRRTLPAPACRPNGFALCLIDTARTPLVFSGEADGGMPDMRVTKWLVFAAEQDSMQIFVVGAGERYLWMSPASAAGFVAEHAINDASWIRARFARAGTYVYSAEIAADSAIVYELRVAPVIATGASWPLGRSATLTIHAAGRAAIVPAAMVPRVEDDSAWVRFAVAPGVYRVLLVRDTNYVACTLPCRRPRHFAVHPLQTVTVSP